MRWRPATREIQYATSPLKPLRIIRTIITARMSLPLGIGRLPFCAVPASDARRVVFGTRPDEPGRDQERQADQGRDQTDRPHSLVAVPEDHEEGRDPDSREQRDDAG